MGNLSIVEHIEKLIMKVPQSAHAARELNLLSKGFVRDIEEFYFQEPTAKYAFYQNKLFQASLDLKDLQQWIETEHKQEIEFNSYLLYCSDIHRDGTFIEDDPYTLQTALNLFGSKILYLSQQPKRNVTIPFISFQPAQSPYSQLQRDLFFVIENGLKAIVNKLKEVKRDTTENILEQSKMSSTIALILAVASIFLVVIFVPLSLSVRAFSITHLETVTYHILMSLNRLPEAFCKNENKSCNELIQFLNEQKEGEKGQHKMMKQHEHRKKNRKVLSIPKNLKLVQDTDSDEGEMQSFVNKEGSTESRSWETRRKLSSSLMNLRNIRGSESQKSSDNRGVKRVNGQIQIDLTHAKSSEVHDEEESKDEGEELTEDEKLQREKEAIREADLKGELRKRRILKYVWLILISLAIAIYFVASTIYLDLVHKYEQFFL